MITKNHLMNARRLSLRTTRNLVGCLASSKKSCHVGNGLEFDQLRDYQMGDSMRSIDWKSSAKHQKLIVRSYFEERDRSIVLLIDVSKSGTFGSGNILRESVINDIAIVVALAALFSHDRIGAIIFHHTVAQIIPARSGTAHINFLINAVQHHRKHAGNGTAVGQALRSCSEHFKKRSLVILVSDLLSSDGQQDFIAIKKRHELVIVRTYDEIERHFPPKLLIALQDPESGVIIETNDPIPMDACRNSIQTWHQKQDPFFKQNGIALCDINVQQPYNVPLINFFKTYGS